LAYVEGLAAHHNGQNLATKRHKTHKTFPHHERPQSDSRRERDLLKQGRKWGCGEGAWGQQKLPCEWTPSPPSGAVLSMIWNILVEKQKLKTDHNFQFLDFCRKQKN